MRKEISRYCKASEECLNKGNVDSADVRSSPDFPLPLLPKLPEGVIVREARYREIRFLATGLPFHIFQDEFCKTLRLIPVQKTSIPLHTDRIGSSQVVRRSLGGSLEKALQAVLPRENDWPMSADLPISTLEMHALYDKILFSVGNNFAGLERYSKEVIFDFFRCEAGDSLLRRICSAPKYYTTQAVILNLARASIEIGDAVIVDFLLTHSLPGTGPDQLICLFAGFHFTAIERAASLRHKSVIRVLLKHCADVNLSHYSDQDSNRSHGALECLIEPFERIWNGPKIKIGEIDPELVKILIEHGGKFRSHYLPPFWRSDGYREVLCSMISNSAVEYPSESCKRNILCEIFAYQDHETLLEILKIMKDSGEDLNFYIDIQDRDKSKRVGNLVDAVATRGDLLIVIKLLDDDVKMTDDTLLCAIESGNEALVRYLLNRGARVDSLDTSSMSPLGQAIRIQNQSIIDLLVDQRGLVYLQSRSHFLSVLEAASWAGDATWFQLLIEVNAQAIAEGQHAALGISIREGHEDLALTLIEAGVNTNPQPTVDRRISERYNPLREALRRGNASIVRSLLAAGADPKYEEALESNVELAARLGDHDIIQSLIDADAKFANSAALANAITRKDKVMANMLLCAGCDINYSVAKWDQKTVLQAAVKTGDLDIINYVLENGADTHDPDAFEESYRQELAVLDILLRKHSALHPNGHRNWGAKLLKLAIYDSNYDVFRKVLMAGADANELLADGFFDLTSPFGHAIANAERSGIQFVELLLQERKMTKCSPETYVSCVSTGVKDQEAREREKFGLREQPTAQATAFLAAIGIGHCSTIELMLRHNADVNLPAQFRRKRTPLQRAVESGNLEIVNLLLSRGANVNAPAALRDGATALQLAAIQGFISIAHLLLEHGAEVNAPASKANGRTALEGAAEHGRLDMVAMLLKAGAGQGGSNQQQITRAIDLAQENGYGYIADMLKRYKDYGRLDAGPVLFDDLINWEPDDKDQE